MRKHHGALAHRGSNEWLASTGITSCWRWCWCWLSRECGRECGEGWARGCGSPGAAIVLAVAVARVARAAVCMASILPADAREAGPSGDSGMGGRTSDLCGAPSAASQGSSAGAEDAIGAWSASIVSKGVSGPVSSSSMTRSKCFERRSMTSGYGRCCVSLRRGWTLSE